MPAPTIRRIQLGKELQRLREAAGVSRPEAAAAIGRSPGHIGHIEVGRNPPSKSDLIVLLRDHYGADKQTLAALEELRAEASKRVEVANLDGHHAVRDSKNPTGPTLRVTTAHWAAFTVGLRDGEFV